MALGSPLRHYCLAIRRRVLAVDGQFGHHIGINFRMVSGQSLLRISQRAGHLVTLLDRLWMGDLVSKRSHELATLFAGESGFAVAVPDLIEACVYLIALLRRQLFYGSHVSAKLRFLFRADRRL